MPDAKPESKRSWAPIALGAVIPAPAGAYSVAVRAGGLVFVSGQIPKDPATGAVVGNDVEGQTRQVLKNLDAILRAAGGTLADVVSVTAYLADPDDWGSFYAVYREVMPAPYPSRTAVGAVLRGIRVELSAVAYIPIG